MQSLVLSEMSSPNKSEQSIEGRLLALNAQKEAFRLKLENLKRKVSQIDNYVKSNLKIFPNPDEGAAKRIHLCAEKVRNANFSRKFYLTWHVLDCKH